MTSQVRPSSPTKKLVTSPFFGSFIVLVYKTMKTKTKTKTKKKLERKFGKYIYKIKLLTRLKPNANRKAQYKINLISN